mgnify:FL=1
MDDTGVKGGEGFPNLSGKAMEPGRMEAFRMRTGAEREAQREWYREAQVAWIWGRYRAYRMEPGVHEGQAEGIEAFLRWGEASDEGASTPAQGGGHGTP